MLSPERILQTGFGFRASRALLSAIELGLFTELGKGPRSSDQLSRALKLNERATPDLLDALVALGFLEREGEGERALYLNTRECAYFLDRASAGYLGQVLEEACGKPYDTWKNLTPALRAGKARRSLSRDGATTAPAAPADPAGVWTESAMGICAQALVERFDFSRYRSAGALGRAKRLFGAAVAGRYPDIEWISAIALARSGRARNRPARSGRPAQASRRPAQAEVIILATSLSSPDLRRDGALLRHMWCSLSKGGSLIVIEALIADDNRRDAFSLLSSLSGHVEPRPLIGFSAQEIEAACRKAGFVQTDTLPLVWPFGAVIALKGDTAVS